MRRVLTAALACALAMAASASAAPPAPAPDPESLQIRDLRVEGGDWQAVNRFHLSWRFDPPGRSPEVEAVHYRVLDAGGEQLGARVDIEGRQETWDAVQIPDLAAAVPPPPGTYTVELWASGGHTNGARERAPLLFDDRAPAPATPLPPPGWVQGGVEALLRIDHPAAPLPASGVRGYAVSVSGSSPAPPCSGPVGCTRAETDLAAGIGDDALALGLLPEGVHFATVVAVSGAGVRSAQRSVEVRVDSTRPELVLAGIPAGWERHPVSVLATATDALSGMRAEGPAGPRTTIAVDGAQRGSLPGDSATAVVSGDGIHSISASARDGAGNVRGESAASPPPTAVVAIDETAPALAFSVAGDPARPELIEATVADPLSGVEPHRGSIALRPVGSEQPFEPVPTTVAGGHLSADWDSDSYPLGAYEFRATGYDRAGNRGSSTRRANGAAMVLVNPVKVPVAIHFGFGGKRLVWHRCVRGGERRRCRRQVIDSFGRRPATRTVPYGRGLNLAGRLVTGTGTALAGRRIVLVESFAAGASLRERTTTVRTGTDGIFRARLSPGPSRGLEARFAGSQTLTRGASRGLRLAVRTAVRLRASAATVRVGGAPVVFSGRIPHLDARIPSYGRPVQLEFRLPGSPWTEFRTVQTDAQGRFRYPYSFSDDDSRGIRFRFRAFAPPQPGWPYKPAASRPVAVTGR